MTSHLAEMAAQTIEPIFKMNGWEWHNDGVPSVERIAETVDYLLATLDEFDSDYVSTGRISVIKNNGFVDIKVDIASTEDYEV